MDLPKGPFESTGKLLYSESKIMPNGQKLLENLVGEVVIPVGKRPGLTNGP
jgi:hypothetical protein